MAKNNKYVAVRLEPATKTRLKGFKEFHSLETYNDAVDMLLGENGELHNKLNDIWFAIDNVAVEYQNEHYDYKTKSMELRNNLHELDNSVNLLDLSDDEREVYDKNRQNLREHIDKIVNSEIESANLLMCVWRIKNIITKIIDNPAFEDIERNRTEEALKEMQGDNTD